LKNPISILVSLVLCISLNAQDAHFTQYYQNAAIINPSLVGNFGGLYKVGVNYRDQWRAALDKPYTTFVAMGESNFDIGEERAPDKAAIGIMFFSDKVNVFDMNTNQIALSGNYRKLLDNKTKQYVGLGFQTGVITKTLNYENLTFGDQFNAIDAYSNETKELLPINNFGFFDLSFGADYSISPASKYNFNIGVSFFHITKPNVSFFAKESNPDLNLDLNSFLNRKFVFHTSLNIPMNESLDMEPRIIYMQQQQNRMAILGSLFKYNSPRSEGKIFYIGPSLRVSNQLKSIGLESVILTAGIELNGLNIGLSYDYNFPDLIDQRNGLGTFELSMSYIGLFENNENFCPKF
jgi:type IX secretion system PorP/SprF family membrane protein